MIDSVSISARRSVTMNQPSFINRASVWFAARLRYWMTVDTAALELYAAVVAIIMGAFLWSPLGTFESSPTFAFVGQVAAEETWGILLMVIGSAQIAGLNGVNHRLREIMALASAVVWAIWGTGLIISNVASTGTVTYSMLTAAMIWSYVSVVVRANGLFEDRSSND